MLSLFLLKQILESSLTAGLHNQSLKSLVSNMKSSFTSMNSKTPKVTQLNLSRTAGDNWRIDFITCMELGKVLVLRKYLNSCIGRYNFAGSSRGNCLLETAIQGHLKVLQNIASITYWIQIKTFGPTLTLVPAQSYFYIYDNSWRLVHVSFLIIIFCNCNIHIFNGF